MDTGRTAFWNARRVMVTGGSGFVGSVVVRRLQALGADLVAPTRGDCDLRDAPAVRDLLASTRPQILIHLAGVVGGIGFNLERPAELFYDNLVMGVHLLHESWRAGVRKFVAVGTVCAYPKLTPVPFREDDLWSGYPEETNAPYGMAKKMLLVQAQAYRRQYGYPAIYLIPVNMYGPGDNFDPQSSHVIPALIRKCLDAVDSGQAELTAWGDGTATREFLYVDDAAEAILLASEHYDGIEPVNVGSAFEISIRELLEIIAAETDFQGRITWDASKPNGQPRRKLDVSRAERLFGFRARTRFEAGLRATIAWYKQARGSGEAP